MANRAIRGALWSLVLVVLLGSLFAIPAVSAASPNYTLTGYVYQPSGAPVPAGVQVDLYSRATGAVYATTTTAGGQFTYTTTSTSGALAPGYWGLAVPPQGNASFVRCSPCAALPLDQNPTYAFYNASDLTPGNPYAPPTIHNVNIVLYSATLSGTVTNAGVGVVGADVELLDPLYENFVVANNTTESAGAYDFKAPPGTWVLKATVPGPLPNYSNVTSVTVANPTTTKDLAINQYLVSGSMLTTSGSPVKSTGNATLFDTANGDIYASPTAPGGYYALGTYPANFTSGSASESFEVVLASVGYATSSYTLVVGPSTPSTVRNVNLPAILPGQLGAYNTTLNFTGFNVLDGNGTLAVTTAASLGNDTVVPTLPNATVGQLWAQLGLDFAHSLSFSSSLLPTFYSWVNASGPFFPAVQAGTAINGTPFVQPTSATNLASESSTCSGSCGLASSASIALRWSEEYALNATVFKNSSTYTLAFNFRHPSNYEAYNYTVVLPSGYVLESGTSAPANSRLVAAGPGGTWTKFTLVSLPGPTPGGTFQFGIERYSALTAIVNASVSNFAFSRHNVLNSTNGNYTVIVGVGQNVTWSALNSIYPAGSNGTKFVWDFGDSSSATVTTPTTYHYYTVASGATSDTGSLTITSSGGLVDTTTFHVWVGSGPVTAGIAWNATARENRTVAGTPYVFVNWSTVLHFNATGSSAQISPSAPIPGNISVASYSLSAWGGFKIVVGNYSVALGGSELAFSNLSYQFLGAGAYLSAGRIAGNSVAFKGWQYNLTLTVWSSSGQSASATLVILVNDTEKPSPAFQLLTTSGKVISGAGIVAGSNASARVLFNAANATDPHNGSVTKYYWLVTNSANTSVHRGINVTAVKPYPSLWLNASNTAYTVNLTVWDLNGNSAYTTQSLTVSVNTTITPIMLAGNLTGPSKLTAGTSYTFWVNITTRGGTKSVADDVRVVFYYTTSGGTSRSYIAGTPSSVVFYNYSSPGVPSASPEATGTLATLAYNATVRAVITWTPVHSGSFSLYANASATNEFPSTTYPGTIAVSITVAANPTTQLVEYGTIGAAVVVVILLIVLYYRRRSRRATAPKSTGRSGLERGGRKDQDEDDEDES